MFQGAQVFIDCQKSVYGVTMNTEANMDAVCNASKDKFPRVNFSFIYLMT